MEQHDGNIGKKKDLALYRIQTAKDNLRSAKILLEAGEYKSANNRAYYAILFVNPGSVFSINQQDNGHVGKNSSVAVSL